MNSMEQLNGWGDEPVEYNDYRPTAVTFGSVTTPSVKIASSAQTIELTECIEVLDLISVPATAYIELDVRNMGDANLYPTVNWGTLPTGFVASTPIPGVFRVTGAFTVAKYEQLNTPVLTYPVAFHGPSIVVTVNVNFTGLSPLDPAVSKSSTITVNWPYVAPYSFSYDEDNDKSLSGYSIQDVNATGNLYTTTLRLDGSIGNLKIGNTSFGNTITFSANTQANINSQLANIVFSPTPNSFANSSVTFSATRTTGNVILANNITSPLVSSGDLPEPVIGEWSLATDFNDYSNRRSGFSPILTITGQPGFQVDTANVTVTVPSIANVATQPVITSTVKTQVGDNTVVQLNGYWGSTKNSTPVSPPYTYINSMNVNITAKNDRNQTSSGTKVLSFHTDEIPDASVTPGTAYQGVISGGVRYYVKNFTVTHRASGLNAPFRTGAYLNQFTSTWTNISSIIKIYLIVGPWSTNFVDTNLITDINADVPTGYAGVIYNLQSTPVTKRETLSYNFATNISRPSPLVVTPQVITQNFAVYVRWDNNFSVNPPVGSMSIGKYLANNLIGEEQFQVNNISG